MSDAPGDGGSGRRYSLSLMEGMDNARASDIMERMAPDGATDASSRTPRSVRRRC